MKFIKKLPDRAELEAIIKVAKSAEDAGRMLGHRGPYVKKYAKLYGIDISHFPEKDGRINLMGKIFGRLTVISKVSNKLDGTTAWLCRCECNKEVEIRTSSLTSGSTKSCGCLKPDTWYHMFEANIKYSAKDASAMMVWRNYYSDADLSFDKFKELAIMNCFYCGIAPSNIANSCKSDPRASVDRQKDADFIYNGLDRVDVNKLHTTDNVVPCCYYCNFSKNDLSIDEFGRHIKQILSHRKIMYNDNFSVLAPPILLHMFTEFLKPKEKATSVNSIELGMTLGKLTVLAQAEKILYKPPRFICRCECGIETIVNKYDLMSGKTRSCNGGLCRGQYSPYISAARAAFNQSRYRHDLKFEEFFELSQLSCSYCGGPPSNRAFSDRSD